MVELLAHTHVVSVMDGHIQGEDWRRHVRQGFESSGLHLQDNGDISRGGDNVGIYSFVTLAEAGELFGGQSWFSLAPEGPWIGKPTGFLAWMVYRKTDIAYIVSWVCRGTVARLDGRESRKLAGLNEFSLGNLRGKHGFDDGDAFLFRDNDDYWRYVLTEIERVLTGAGCVGNVGVFGTHHNPVRLSGDLTRGAETIDHDDCLLDNLRVKLYMRNLSLLSSSPFWDDL